MKITEFGVGKITAQNTTQDVKPGETERQAKKLGLMNGKPRLLHKTAAKNSDPNTLFNLGLAEDYKEISPEKMETWIRAYADRHGVDPDTAVKVWKSEGGMNYQSTVKKGNQQKYKGAEDSWGPFQLYRGGGLGNEWEKTYGKDLRSANDATSIQQQIDFAMQNAAKSGWGQWYGAAKVGVKDRQGIPKKPLTTKYKPIDIIDGPTDSQIQKHIASKKPQPSLSDKITNKVSQAWDSAKPEIKDIAKRGAAQVLDIAKRGGEEVADVAKNISKGNINKDSWAYKNIVKPLTQDVNELKIEKPDPKDTLGVKRKEMPQVKSDDYAEFIAYLKKNGAKFTKETIPARELKAMQKEFSDEGIMKQLMKNIEQGPNRKAVIASSDDYIMDGHHRWLVAINTGADLNVFRVNLPAYELYDLVNKFEKTYYKDIYERGSIGVPLASGLVMKLFPHRPLKIAKSTPGKLRYDEAVTQVDIDQLERFADKLFAKVGIDVEFTRHFLDRVNDERNKKPITMAELTRLFKQEFKRWSKPIAQMGPGQEAVMKDLQTDINLPFALQYDKDNNELDLIAKTVMRKKDFKTPDREFPVEGWSAKYKSSINCSDPKGFSQKAHCAGKKKKKKSESINEETGKEMFAYFQKIHHDPDSNSDMKKFILSHDWELRDFTPDMFPSEEEFFDYDDPFDRIIDIDYYYRADLSQPIIVGPQYADGKYSVIDGNHRAAAAQGMGKTIKGYFPVKQVNEDDSLGSKINFPGFEKTKVKPKPKYNPVLKKDKSILNKVKGWFTDDINEAYVLRLEDDDDMLVLHIRDTKSGERVEVRGKPNYEIDYDENDELHQLLDVIGKASNISDLMNGKIVNINPKHPDGPKSYAAIEKVMGEDDASDKVYELLLDKIGAGPFDGGCVVVAQALQKIHGGELMALVRNDGTADHAVVQKGNTMYDFDGPGTQQEVVSRFEKNEGTRIAEVRKLRMTDLPDAPRNSELAKQIASLMKEPVQEAKVDEGVNDPHIFKAVFLAGGPGSGKSFVAKNILGGTGLRSINSDEVYEFLMKKQDLSLDPETIFSPQGQEIRDRAKDLSRKREATYLDGRLGLIIDGTGKDVSKYQVMAQKLKAIGYDVAMIFVNTSLEVAQQRNMQRERSLKPAKVEQMWNDVQQNLMKFQQIFGAGRFHIIDNSGGLEDLDRQKNFDKVYNETQRFLNTPLKNRKALAWIQQQKEQNDEKRSAQQPQQPSKQSDGGTTETN